MAAPQSLFNLWMESSFIDNKGWLVDYLKRLNPTVSKIKGFVDEQTGAWDFSFADMVASSVPCEISYRPYSIYENDYWKQMPAKQFVAMAKSRLQGRKYRVNVGCEPSPNANDLAAVLKWTVELMQEGDVQGVDFDVLSIPVQYLTMFTNDPRDISKGMWRELARVAGFLRGKMRIVYHMYTGLVLPAGTFDDSYLREIAHKRELLQQPYTWATYEQITDPTNLQRYRTRHLFRHKWLNYYALEQGFQEHDYYIGEAGWDWFGGEWDLGDTWARANGIAGSDLDICLPDKRFVSGIRTLANFWRWKFPQWTFKEAAVNQLTWLGAQLAKDPRCKGWAYYAYTFKEGDQQPYNAGVYKDVLEGMIGANMVNVATPPPVDDDPDAPIPDDNSITPESWQRLQARVKALEAWRKTREGEI